MKRGILSIGAFLFLAGLVLSADDPRGIQVKAAADAGVAGYDPSRFHALMIGVDQYKYWTKLRTAAADANAVADALERLYGFPTAQVKRLIDGQATRRNILRELDRLSKLGGEDSVVIYYAGHGWMDDLKNGYWVPVEAPEDDKTEYVSNAQIVQESFKKYKVRHLLVITDSCFSGALLRGKDEKRQADWRLPAGFRKPSRWVLTSGDLAPVPDDAGTGHSPFATRLLQYLENSDLEAFGIYDMFTWIRRLLKTESICQPLDTEAHMPGGEFVFCRMDKPLPPRPPVPPVARPVAPEPPPAPTPTVRLPAGFRAEGSATDGASGLPITIVHAQTGYRLKLVPGGEFFLGSPDGEGSSDEHPRRRIYLDSYWIGETEVTCAQFARFLNEKGNQSEGGVTWANMGQAIKIQQSGSSYTAKPGFENYPVVEVSWFGARAYSRWMGGDLPTEAQWEKAAKGGREVKWPWGNTWDSSKANTAERLAGVRELTSLEEWLKWWEPYQKRVLVDRGDYSDTTVPVANYRANDYGLYDMAGNVWEWCLDWYAADAYSQLRDGVRNPDGPYKGDMQTVEYWQGGEKKSEQQSCRVVRGGGWLDQADSSRCLGRGGYLPAVRLTSYGFRVVVLPRP